MSDEDREIDIESDADDEDTQTFDSDDKRAHHNALERKRRDHIKDSFHSLRDCVPQDDQLKTAIIVLIHPVRRQEHRYYGKLPNI